jgi:hypothetical protein
MDRSSSSRRKIAPQPADTPCRDIPPSRGQTSHGRIFAPADYELHAEFLPFTPAADGRDNRPLASLSRTGLEKLFHSWLGASGRRYVCSVYSVGAPPVFDGSRAVVAAVRRGALQAEIAFVFTAGPDDEDFAFWTARARAQGACEWHVHLLAETPEARAAVLRDLTPARRLAA